MGESKVVVIPGDGIGPEITKAALAVLEALDCGLEFEMAVAGLAAQEAGRGLMPKETVDLIAEHGVGQEAFQAAESRDAGLRRRARASGVPMIRAVVPAYRVRAD